MQRGAANVRSQSMIPVISPVSGLQKMFWKLRSSWRSTKVSFVSPGFFELAKG
jgi:hypothetical protein